MKKQNLGVLLVAVFVLGCAKLNVETAKPLKVDINMRVDIYQHVVKDIDDINDQIYGKPQSKLNMIFNYACVYALETSSLEEAIARRRDRVQTIEDYFAKGYIGENKNALLEIRPGAPEEVANVVNQENSDRQTLYQITAQKNGSDVTMVQKVSFEKDYNRAASGYWFEVSDPDGSSLWKQK